MKIDLQLIIFKSCMFFNENKDNESIVSNR